MDNRSIIGVITAIFEGADERDWQKVQRSMADEVLLDYTSMNGNSPSITSSAEIIEAWKGFLPGFESTRHQVSDFQIRRQGENLVKVHFSGKAEHVIGTERWTVEGTYDVEEIRSANDWKITKFKFNLQNQTGNTALPQQAARRAAEGNKAD